MIWIMYFVIKFICNMIVLAYAALAWLVILPFRILALPFKLLSGKPKRKPSCRENRTIWIDEWW